MADGWPVGREQRIGQAAQARVVLAASRIPGRKRAPGRARRDECCVGSRRGEHEASPTKARLLRARVGHRRFPQRPTLQNFVRYWTYAMAAITVLAGGAVHNARSPEAGRHRLDGLSVAPDRPTTRSRSVRPGPAQPDGFRRRSRRGGVSRSSPGACVDSAGESTAAGATASRLGGHVGAARPARPGALAALRRSFAQQPRIFTTCPRLSGREQRPLDRSLCVVDRLE